MKILQLCHKPPYPAIDGGSIASLNLTKGLIKNESSVQILAINTYKQYCDLSKVPKDFLKQTQYKLIYLDIKVRVLSAFFNLFSSKSYNISRFDSQLFRNELKIVLSSSKFDIIILESLYTSPYLNTLRALHKGLIVLRSHNVEYKIWENLSKNTKNPFKKWYLTLLSKRLKKYELETLNKVDLIASISASDIEIFKKEGCVTDMKHIPFGLNFEEKYFKEYSPPEINELVLFHVGSMDWIPHQEAFKWFFDKVWIEFNLKHPETKLFLAGSKMPHWLIDNKYKNVLVTNDYVDAKEFSKGKAIMIVPSFSGSGIRIKIAEGMAKGKVIVTTTNGAMGIPCSHGENIFISDNPEEWNDILHECVTNLSKVQEISLNARTFSLQEFDFISVAKKLLDFLKFDK
jgi:polysaccharide biosynthesis protein PslH